jgi:hypothetical protein
MPGKVIIACLSLLLRRNYERGDQAEEEAGRRPRVAHPGGRSAGHADGLRLLQNARHKCPGHNPRRGHSQEARAPADDGGRLPDNPEQPLGHQAHRRLQQPHEDHVQNRSRILHRRYAVL